MTSTLESAVDTFTIDTRADGNLQIDLVAGTQSVCRLILYPFTLRIGRARIRMDGIGRVWTEEGFRNRGYCRRVMDFALDRMRHGDAALAMLYGIPDFYPRFGYATAGPEHCLHLTRLTEPADLPPGWRIRDFEPGDMPAIRALYDRSTESGIGAVDSETRSWTRLLKSSGPECPDRCRVTLNPAREVRGYAWTLGHWAVHHLEKRYPDAFIVPEALACEAEAAEAILALCRTWAVEGSVGREIPYQQVIVGTQPEGALVRRATTQNAVFSRQYARCGESMARTIDVARLLGQMAPELAWRLQKFLPGWPAGRLRISTDIGGADLAISGDRILATDLSPREAPTWKLQLPQWQVARLCLGAYPPEDILDSLELRPDPATFRLVTALFPIQQPHMHIPDRY